MTRVLLKAKDLCKSYATDGLQTHVISHMELEINEKDFTVIMGSSGSGKSTLLYCLSGMDEITSGEV
ncbi:ABC transporter [Clostridium sp. DSM 8431]|uniref:ATP-binding cassette domain-containing protein n=1 Tax=Clostridium sp. DSM 8431 TaxID=1761781 RepID=UPI0008EB466B|nr:ABC transporter [Clostridium sp. DSM 8431]